MNNYNATRNFINNSMFAIDSSGPHSREIVLQWFWFTYTAKRIVLNCVDKLVNS